MTSYTTGNRAPLLFVDVDGVISLFGFDTDDAPPGQLHWINGVLHHIASGSGEHLLRLGSRYEMVWATGWEETANDYLPYLLGLPDPLPCLSFNVPPRFGTAHWKISAIEEYAGARRPLAWIDDSLDDFCRAWARNRPGPTLLVATRSDQGMLDEHVDLLIDWAEASG